MTGAEPSPGASDLLRGPASAPLPSSRPHPHRCRPTLHSLSIHTQHHAQGGVPAGGEVISVAAHADGVQPVPHGEAPAATPAPTEVKAALGKGRGRAPETQGPLISGLPGPLPSSGTLALATLSLHAGSVVGKGSDDRASRPERRGLRKAQAGLRSGAQAGQGSGAQEAQQSGAQAEQGSGAQAGQGFGTQARCGPNVRADSKSGPYLGKCQEGRWTWAELGWASGTC